MDVNVYPLVLQSLLNLPQFKPREARERCCLKHRCEKPADFIKHMKKESVCRVVLDLGQTSTSGLNCEVH